MGERTEHIDSLFFGIDVSTNRAVKTYAANDYGVRISDCIVILPYNRLGDFFVFSASVSEAITLWYF